MRVTDSTQVTAAAAEDDDGGGDDDTQTARQLRAPARRHLHVLPGHFSVVVPKGGGG